MDFPINLVGEERWSTYGVFNSNAFPDELSINAEACSTRAAILLAHLNMIKEAIKKDEKDFRAELKKYYTDSFVVSLRKRPSDKFVAYYDGIDYLAAFHGFLNSLKSFLDVYATLICRTIQPSSSTLLFGAKPVEGGKISGGRVINWLKRSAPITFKHSSKLQKAIENHSNNWITEAVNHRDTLSHYGDIKEMEHMHIDLTPSSFKFEEIFPPLMPNGQPVVDYCSYLLDELKVFIEESLILLPGLKKEHISFNKFLILDRTNS
jgi:hypothetical protein